MQKVWNPGIIIAARTGSARLPGKHFKMIGDESVLNRVLGRCLSTGLKVVLAVPADEQEEFHIASHFDNDTCGVEGDESDVLLRVMKAASESDFDPIIRVTGDCPFAEPAIILGALALWFEKRRIADPAVAVVASNVFPYRTFAKGLDVEVVERAALELVLDGASDYDREHVTSAIYRLATPPDHGETYLAALPESAFSRNGVAVFGFKNNGWWPDSKAPDLCIDTPEDLIRLGGVM